MVISLAVSKSTMLVSKPFVGKKGTTSLGNLSWEIVFKHLAIEKLTNGFEPMLSFAGNIV